MTQRLFSLLMVVVAALLQQLLPGWALFGGMKPPVLTALTAYFAMHRTGRELWIPVGLCTLLYDGLEMGSFGPALLTFPVIALVINRVRTEVFAEGLVTQMIFGMVSAVLVALVSICIYVLSGQRLVPPGTALVGLFGAMCLGTLTLPLTARAMRRLEALLPQRREYGWQ